MIDLPTGPVRCQRCRAYMNHYNVFIDGGKSFVCKFCDCVNEVPKDYFSPLNLSGKRSDGQERKELIRGAVDYVAPAEMQQTAVGAGRAPPCLFAIDVSYNSVASGMLHTAVSSLKYLFQCFEATNNQTRFGIITYDTSVHFYSLGSTQPHMHVMACTLNTSPSYTGDTIPNPSDPDSPFVPIGETSMFVTYQAAKKQVDSVLDKIIKMFGNNKVSDSAMGLAMLAAHDCLVKYFFLTFYIFK